MATENTKTRDRIERVRRLLKSSQSHTRALLSVLHPTEIAQVLEDTPTEIQQRILKELPADLISEAISEMDEETHPGKLLTFIKPEVASNLIKELAPDDAADLLAQIPEDYKEKILSFIPDEEEDVLNQLLTYEEDSAGGLMNPEVVVVKETMTKLDALREVVSQSEDMDEFYSIYVVDEDERLKGYLTFRSLFLARNNQIIKDVMGSDVISVVVNTDQEEVAKVMSQYNLPTLPVVDHENKLLGRITFDDIMDVIEEENTEDALKMAGISEGENLRGGWANSVKSRIPWLMVNLITASVAMLVVGQFGSTIEKVALVASLMPIIAGVAGNGATQTLAVTVRRISTDGIPARKAFPVILKEISVGAINGLMIGAIASVAVAIYNAQFNPQVAANPQLEVLVGVVVFSAMFGNLILAGLMGSFIPITLERLGIDPAVASSILITAFTDIIGYLLLFGLASKILLPVVNTVNQGGVNLITPVL